MWEQVVKARQTEALHLVDLLFDPVPLCILCLHAFLLHLDLRVLV